MEGLELGGDQQFCLRWNNFQANITSQFEALRDDEDFVDVTLACEGHRLEAHKVVLSACSPYFKELFKNNPCPHPIVFMRDCEAVHIRALLDFMYAGQVNIAQAQLSAFLRTAEALQIRGLTDASPPNLKKSENKSPPSQLRNLLSTKQHSTGPTETPSPTPIIDSYMGSGEGHSGLPCEDPAAGSSLSCDEESVSGGGGGSGGLGTGGSGAMTGLLQPKIEGSDNDEYGTTQTFYGNNTLANPFATLAGNFESLTGTSGVSTHATSEIDFKRESFTPSGAGGRVPDEVWLEQHRRSLPFSVSSRERPFFQTPKLIKLGEGVEVREEQLRGVKWGDYRKVTRGLAAALFTPTELATCSVTGQRWSRAGQEARPTKPPLDKRRVQALISYVTRQFPDVETSRIKQVLAYKCKENCAALRMRAASDSGAMAGSGRAPPEEGHSSLPTHNISLK